MERPWQELRGKPSRGFTEHILSAFVYTTDPGEASYYAVRALGYEYLDRLGIEKPSGEPTKRGNALYYYKQAQKYGDQKAAKKWLKEYFRLGGTMKGLKLSVKRTNPLAAIPKKYRLAFLQQLTPTEREMARLAFEWYLQTYRGKKRGENVR
jgi:hypothetical protein